MFWVAVMGVSIGLFSGLLFADASSSALMKEALGTSSITRCLIVLLAVVILFLTYQNKLSPLQTFGFFFLSAYAAEKLFSYILFPYLLALFGAPSPEASNIMNLLVYAASSIAMILFLLKLCRGSALKLLFSTGGAVDQPGATALEQDARRTACESVARQFALTRRELEILAYLAAGYSAKKIGESLCISERTVQTHSLNIYRKLGVHNRQMVIDLVEERAFSV